MKRNLTKLLTLITVLVLLCVSLVACGNESGGGTPHTHTMIKAEKKDATCTENGNVEYYTCSGCGKYFSDINGSKEITLSETVIYASHQLT